jgi:hypothetical protein
VTRRLATLALLLAATMLALVAAQWLGSFTERTLALAERAPEAAARRIETTMRWLTLGGTTLALAAAAHVVWTCIRALRTNQFPPPGAWTLSHRQPVTGPAARFSAWFGLALAAALVACAISLPILFGKLLACMHRNGV